ncbi:PREDICTED: uncharacterized protein LOC109183419 [Ipomoea nil]|uniref:uncharacterized protein LOC109183419 n=1 Tax=Ipomoea nil TaxID=35883 RepID=UPI0009015B20|nr:PREDICTED: uncharacterized protein LOC109183419 [Ipomoea nil]
MRSLDEKLASALDECNAKDELVTKFTKMAEEAIAAHKKAEAEIMCLKEELEEWKANSPYQCIEGLYAEMKEELAIYGPISNDISSISSHESKKEHQSVSTEAWACALISELEHFKNHKDQKSNSEQKMIGVSEMRLMDDFVEMEKLAIVANIFKHIDE